MSSTLYEKDFFYNFEQKIKKFAENNNKKVDEKKIDNFLNYLKLKLDLIFYEQIFMKNLFSDDDDINCNKMFQIFSSSRNEEFSMKIQKDELSPLDKTCHTQMKSEKLLNPHQNINMGLVGFKNIGNTCFLGSILQCLINTSVLSEFCIKQVPKMSFLEHPNPSLLKDYSKMVKEVWEGGRTSIDPIEFKSNLSKNNSKVNFLI